MDINPGSGSSMLFTAGPVRSSTDDLASTHTLVSPKTIVTSHNVGSGGYTGAPEVWNIDQFWTYILGILMFSAISFAITRCIQGSWCPTNYHCYFWLLQLSDGLSRKLLFLDEDHMTLHEKYPRLKIGGNTCSGWTPLREKKGSCAYFPEPMGETFHCYLPNRIIPSLLAARFRLLPPSRTCLHLPCKMGWFFVTVTVVLLNLTLSLAQESEVTCLPSFDWVITLFFIGHLSGNEILVIDHRPRIIKTKIHASLLLCYKLIAVVPTVFELVRTTMPCFVEMSSQSRCHSSLWMNYIPVLTLMTSVLVIQLSIRFYLLAQHVRAAFISSKPRSDQFPCRRVTIQLSFKVGRHGRRIAPP